MLEAVDLSCERGSHTLFSGLSFTLAAGEMLLVTGPNGAGKTSLLRMLCGLTPPAAGEVRWQGRALAACREAFLSELFYLGHQNAVKDDLTPLENLLIGATLAGESPSQAQALAALAEMGLAGREHFLTKTLSQGQRRRVALARLLVTRARLWILDEPLTALDARAVTLLQHHLHAHLAGGGLVVLTTHQPLEVGDIPVRRLELGGA